MLITRSRGAATAPRQVRRGAGVAAVAVIAIASLSLDGSRTQRAPVLFASSVSRRAAFAAFDSLASSGATQGSAGEAPMRAIIVASPRDCRGNLLIANVLGHRGVASVVGLPELVVAGIPTDTIGLRQTLPRAVRGASLRLLSADERVLLRSIGHQETPIMLLFDRFGRLQFATHAKSDPVARTADMRAIHHLTMRDPTH